MVLPVYEEVCAEMSHPQISAEDLAILNDPFAVIPTKDAVEESEEK